jgi:hypothetical protein
VRLIRAGPNPCQRLAPHQNHGIVGSSRQAGPSYQNEDTNEELNPICHFASSLKSAINNVIFPELAWSRRGKFEMHAGFVTIEFTIEFDLRRFAFGWNEIRAVQKFERFRQFCIRDVPLPNRFEPECPGALENIPVNEFCQRRNHVLVDFFQ